jgi:uncharacterized protein (UPF0276 family)
MSSSRDVVGVGIGLRRAHFDALRATQRRVDWLEFTPENVVGIGGPAASALAACAERWPLVAHGVSLSLGGPSPLDLEFVDSLRSTLDRFNVDRFSEHACWSRAGDAHSLDLLALPWTVESAAHLAARSRALAALLERPILLENVTTYAVMPGSELAEGAWLRAVFDRCDARMLLDVSNLWINATNASIDPLSLLDSMPLDRVAEIHLAGHRFDPKFGLWIDDHASAVSDPVWRLYEQTLARVGPVPTLIEWDQDVPSLDVVLDVADRARALWSASVAAPSEPRRSTAEQAAP